MLYTMKNEILSVSVSDLGAELVRAEYRGKERLWQNKDGSWDGHAPILFPFCGRCRMVLDGRDYGEGFHGFASGETFTCVRREKTRLCLCLTENERTLPGYPFRFAFFVEYALNGERLIITYRVENRSQKTMYFACGAHDSFALSEPAACFALEFPQTERFLYRLHDGNGRLTGQTEDHGSGTRLSLENRDSSMGDTVILRDIRSRSVRLLEKETERCLAQISFPGFSNLLLWHPKNSRMICIEPWQNLPDDACGQGDFTAKAGVRSLAPGRMAVYQRTIQYF